MPETAQTPDHHELPISEGFEDGERQLAQDRHGALVSRGIGRLELPAVQVDGEDDPSVSQEGLEVPLDPRIVGVLLPRFSR